MVNYCRVNGCHSKSDREKDKSFYRLPEIISNQCGKTERLSEERRRLWLASLQQDFSGKTLKNIRVCSDHFISNKKADLFDRDNPDWVPSVNMGTVKKAAAPKQLSGRYERKKMRERKTDAARTLLMISDQVPETDDHESMDFTPLPEEDTNTGTSTQTDISFSYLDAMERENTKLKCENVKLKEHLKNMHPYSMEAFSEKDEKVRFFTGLTCFAVLMTVFKYVEPFIPTKLTMGKFECLTMTLCRLRLNLSVNFLSHQLNVSNATISRIIVDVIDVLYARMKPLVMWPDRDSLRKTMPVQFQKQFGKKCAVIIDCFEVFIERPSNVKVRAETWSSYKHHNTIKFLIGITPQGVISFISKSWGGRTSDKHLTEHCGFLDNILPGDLILADRGFDISASVSAMMGSIKIPAFTKGRDQLSPLDIEETRHIANVRIHVENVIGLVRQKYTILSSTIPIDLVMIKDDEGFTTMDKIAHVCCSLVNLCESVVDFG